MSNLNDSNAPKKENASSPEKKPLTADQKAYLNKVDDENYAIKKSVKKQKESLSDNARPLTKVRRMDSANTGEQYSSVPMNQVNDLRIANASDEQGGAFVAAAKKTRNLIVTLIIVIAILAIIGAGSLVTMMVINNDTREVNLDTGLTFYNEGAITTQITNYQVGTMLEFPVGIVNDTNAGIDARFRINVVYDELYQSLAAKGLQASDLSFEYRYSEQSWEERSGEDNEGWLFSKNSFNSSNNAIYIITGFKVNCNPDKIFLISDETITIQFVVEYGATN